MSQTASSTSISVAPIPVEPMAIDTDLLLARFLKYVRIHTTSNPNSDERPSTLRQFDLARVLALELEEMGYADVYLSPECVLYATVPASEGHELEPVVCLCAHMDTSPDADGENVEPLVHAMYDGAPLALPHDTSIVLSTADDPALARQVGNTLITASGRTLLGADNKAGVAAIMQLAYELSPAGAYSQWPHGTVRLLFTPDEEIGHGTDNVDLTRLGADLAYTLDGEERGTLENETWNGSSARVVLEGVSAHPGFALGKLVNALTLAADFVLSLPADEAPETTSGRDGFYHVVAITGSPERAEIKMILRDFELAGEQHRQAYLQNIAETLRSENPKATISVTFEEQYRNMHTYLAEKPEVTQRALDALRACGMEPILKSVRGGTDGSRLSAMGLPCPNLFVGEHGFHSKKEWVSLEDMKLATQVALQICKAGYRPTAIS
jgi:tripeptide aminopeptidase